MAEVRGQSAYSGDVVPDLPGYRIERQLGRGSMGVVYLAENVQLHRKVALKILAPTLADDELFRKRFDRELQSAANLDHPHIVPVYAAGQGAGSLYIAMRYVSGGDLRTLLESSGPLSLAQATSIVESVADALDTAHGQGVIHRDVKPANILIDDRNDRPHYYLSDFGITKLVAAGRSLTSTRQIIGTIDYIAPEQIQGKPVDGRADLYALGCVLYQCLTGVVPFPRDETSALMFSHLNDAPPSITARRPDLPPQIDAIVAKAIAKQPEDRYDTCRELAGALRVLTADPADAGGSLGGAPAVLPVGPASPPPMPAGMTGTYIPPVPPPARPQADSASKRRRKWLWIAAGAHRRRPRPSRHSVRHWSNACPAATSQPPSFEPGAGGKAPSTTSWSMTTTLSPRRPTRWLVCYGVLGDLKPRRSTASAGKRPTSAATTWSVPARVELTARCRPFRVVGDDLLFEKSRLPCQLLRSGLAQGVDVTGFDVSTAEVAACSKRLVELSHELDAELKDVRSVVDALLKAGWRGQAASGFAQGWDEWQAGAAQVQVALATMSQLLGVTGGNYNLSDGQAEGGMNDVAVNLS